MKKIINSIPYSTDSSCRLGYFQHRTILDPTYCREELYITRQGTYFLYVEGRESSPYCFQGDPFPTAGCDLTVLSDIEARIYSGSVVKTKIQAFYNEPISVAELGRCPR